MKAAEAEEAVKEAARSTLLRENMVPLTQMSATRRDGGHTKAEFQEYESKMRSANDEFARTPTRPDPVKKSTEHYDVKVCSNSPDIISLC